MKEQLHIIIKIVMVAFGDELRKEAPMSGGVSEFGPSAQYSTIILCSSVSAELKQFFRLGQIVFFVVRKGSWPSRGTKLGA
jgi:hypothetical protein